MRICSFFMHLGIPRNGLNHARTLYQAGSGIHSHGPPDQKPRGKRRQDPENV